ncbi:MAG: class I SAM-dependent methyltransferase [Planctomycetes bacterium]|nr:class I SAM-dependent methyltransferase [Planctomycetota bacterium]
MLREVHGWLQVSEGQLLYELSRDWPGSGRVVELGSYQGRSTVCLASGLRDRREGASPLIAIDTHRGSKEHQPGKLYFDPDTWDREKATVNTLPFLLKNLARFGLSEYVDVWRCSSVEAGARFKGAIRILFIDADHDETSVRQDILCWGVFLGPKGVMILHDVGVWPGPTRVAEEVLRQGRFRILHRVATTLALVSGES